MKKSIKFLSICLLAAGMSACSAKPGDSQSDSANETPDSSVAIAQEQAIQDSINQAVQDSIAKAEEAANAEKADIQTIKTLYAKCVLLDFDKGPDDNYGKAHVTPAMLKKLKAAYEYDDGGIAWYALRTGAQDGDGPSKVTAVEPLGDGWYKVSFLDMGAKGSRKIKMESGKLADYK